MSSVLTMLSLVSVLLCGLAFAANVDASIKSPDKAEDRIRLLDGTIKGLSVHTASDDTDIQFDGHTDETASSPMEGTKMNTDDDTDDDSGGDTTRMLANIGNKNLVLPTAEHQWRRRCGATIKYDRPAACELNLRSFTERLVRLDRVRISALVAYGAIGVQVHLLFGEIIASVGLAVNKQPTKFSLADDITGKKALWVFPINSLPAPRKGSCCWRRVNFTVRIYSCLLGNCGIESLKYHFILRCKKVCFGRGRPLPMNKDRKCPWCRR